MTPIVDGLEEEFADRAAIVRLDASQVDVIELQQAYGVQGHPSFVVLDQTDSVSARFFGPQSAEDLRAALTAVLPADGSSSN